MATIGIQTWGSQGDVQPFLALATALATHHDIKLLISTEAEAQFDDTPGVSIERVGPKMTRAEGAALIEEVVALSSPMKQGRVMMKRAFEPLAGEMTDAAMALAQEVDLVIRHHFLHMTQAAAMAHQTPEISVFLEPDLLPTREHPPTGMPSLGPLQQLGWWMMAKGAGGIFMPPAIALRKKLGLTQPNNLMNDVWSSQTATLIATSPTLSPRPSDWPETYHMTGTWRAPVGEQLPIDEGLDHFIEASDATVYVSFGSMMPTSEHGARHIIELVIDAAKHTSSRLVIQAPKASWKTCDDVYFVERAPHAVVFPRCQAVIHHGGAGTTQTALRAGCPSVIVPHLGDQFFWGPCIEALGAGRCAPSKRKLTATQLARALKDVVSDPTHAQRAAHLGVAMQQEDGLAHAVDVIGQVLTQHQ